MLLFLHYFVYHTAEALELGIFCKPSVDSFALKLENKGGNEPGSLSCRNGEISYLGVKRLKIIVRGIYRKSERCIVPELFDQQLNVCHIRERGKESLCARGDSLLMCAECFDLFGGESVIRVERRIVLVYYREIPFVFSINIFSVIVYHNVLQKYYYLNYT